MPKISILLPTRGRPALAEVSVDSVVSTASKPEELEILLGVDNDDEATKAWAIKYAEGFNKAGTPVLKILIFNRLGYHKMHEYLNKISHYSSGKWLMVWNDDAKIETKGWDDIVLSHTKFEVLRMQVRNHDHPFALFPIVPRAWYDLLSFVSPSAQSDRFIYETCQRTWRNPMVDIPVNCIHDRFDITGNNNDKTYQERIYMEGDPTNPEHADSPEVQVKVWQSAMLVGRHIAQLEGIL